MLLYCTVFCSCAYKVTVMLSECTKIDLEREKSSKFSWMSMPQTPLNHCDLSSPHQSLHAMYSAPYCIASSYATGRDIYCLANFTTIPDNLSNRYQLGPTTDIKVADIDHTWNPSPCVAMLSHFLLRPHRL